MELEEQVGGTDFSPHPECDPGVVAQELHMIERHVEVLQSSSRPRGVPFQVCRSTPISTGLSGHSGTLVLVNEHR